MKTSRGSIKIINQLYKDMRARFPVLRVVLDVVLLSFIITFIVVCNGNINADKNVLIFLDIVFGIIAFFIAVCLYRTVQDFLNMKKFYAETDAENEYEFFANAVGIYQRRLGRLFSSEVLYYTSIAKATENKTYFNLFRNDYEIYPVSKAGLSEEELNAIRHALKLNYNGKKCELQNVELEIPPYIAIVLKEEKDGENPPKLFDKK